MVFFLQPMKIMNTQNLTQKKLVNLDRIRVEPFLAFGNEKKIFVKGRVISSYKRKRPSSRKSWLSNIIATIKRYSVTSIPDALVEIHFHQHRFEVTTDEDGVFEIQIEVENPSPKSIEHVNFKVLSPVAKKNSTWVSKEVNRYNDSVGVISDIDDTVLISHSTQLGKKLWLSISKNAYTRRPLPGVSKFYHELTHRGEIPIFYVSSSDWSLYDLIRDFLRYRNIPVGPTLLKDKHINLKNVWKSGGGSHDHKLEKIRNIFSIYPKMKFFLIGDSGQHDPEIYAKIIQEYPNRVKAVFIRLVGELEADRKEKLAKIIALDNFFFIESSEEAIELAEKNHFI